VTQTLYSRLTQDEIAAIDSYVDEFDPIVLVPAPPSTAPRFVNVSALISAASEIDRKRIALAIGTHAGIPGVQKATHLRPEEPPEHVHAMARGPLAAGGSTYSADLVVAALRSAGRQINGLRVLDFGCSSGRVVRVLSAAFPDVEWHGWDPNPAAVAWAQAHLPSIAFRSSADEPPLPYADATFDFVYAISVWSHFDEDAALRWLAEMRRVVRPGGHLLITAHGLTALSYFVEHGVLDEYDARMFREKLADRGFAFHATFATDADWGIQSTEWGDAYLTPEWLLTHACPAWHIVEYGAGRDQGNQDVYVMKRT
jgi:SAM-dependent methyltransferase